MDFLFSTGIRKLPKIPDKNNFYSFPLNKNSLKNLFLKITVMKTVNTASTKN